MKRSLYLLFFISQLAFADGEKLVRENCASCHEDENLNLLSLSSMTYLTQSELMYVLQNGKMKQQASHLSTEEKETIAKYIAQSAIVKSDSGSTNNCSKALEKTDLEQSSSWPSWGYDNFNTRNQRFSSINTNNIKNLKLRWSFGIGSQDVRAQPIVIGDVVLISDSDSLHALNRKDGCSYWKFQSKARLRNAPVLNNADGESIFLVDSDFEVYKLNIMNGELIWTTKIPVDYESNIPSASPIQSGNYLIVPISTYETVLAMDPRHECCKTSGGIAAVGVDSGKILWTHRIEEEPKNIGKGLITRVKKFAPSGSAVWNAPGIDVTDKRIFFGTGQSLQSPASQYSDAIISMDLESGEKIWATQTLKGDAYNMGCEIPGIRRMVCPKEKGPDFDFGASVIQSKDKNGRKILLAGQKSGWVFKLNHDTGEILWKSKVGNGGVLGGVHFGMTTDNNNLYVPISDRETNRDYDKEARPGLYAVNFENGEILWEYPLESVCESRKALYGEGKCTTGFSAAISMTNDVIFAGALDGRFSAHSSEDGSKIWEFDTLRNFKTVNGVPAVGGSIDSAGPVIVDNWVFVNSGYSQHGQMAGNVILAFSLD